MIMNNFICCIDCGLEFDTNKNSFMRNKNKLILRFWENEIYNQLEYVSHTLSAYCGIGEYQ